MLKKSVKYYIFSSLFIGILGCNKTSNPDIQGTNPLAGAGEVRPNSTETGSKSDINSYLILVAPAANITNKDKYHVMMSIGLQIETSPGDNLSHEVQDKKPFYAFEDNSSDNGGILSCNSNDETGCSLSNQTCPSGTDCIIIQNFPAINNNKTTNQKFYIYNITKVISAKTLYLPSSGLEINIEDLKERVNNLITKINSKYAPVNLPLLSKFEDEIKKD